MSYENIVKSHYLGQVSEKRLDSKSTSSLSSNVKKRNTHFSRFFSELLPPQGNYAPVQFYCLKEI